MRRYHVWTLVGASLIILGAGWLEFYATIIYPELLYCSSNPPTPCPSPLPLESQPAFGLGELAIFVGGGLLVLGLVQWIRIGRQVTGTT